jgi:hypothetical protein
MKVFVVDVNVVDINTIQIMSQPAIFPKCSTQRISGTLQHKRGEPLVSSLLPRLHACFGCHDVIILVHAFDLIHPPLRFEIIQQAGLVLRPANQVEGGRKPIPGEQVIDLIGDEKYIID